jgi:hypothetical protein
MYWDLASFTTRLNDLRFFLHALISEIRCMGDVKIRVWERQGVKSISLCDHLDEYNLSMCYYPEFSFERFIEFAEDTTTTLMSRQGGLLGVPGNIGFSTSLHGFVSEMTTGTGKSVCVGDDAAAVGLHEAGLVALTEQIQRIGLIPDDKFGRISIANPYGRFLKRGLSMDQQDGVVLHDYLPSMPNMVELLGVNVPDRTQSQEVTYFRAKKMVQDVARVLWFFHHHPDQTTDGDINTLSNFAIKAYQVFNLPGCGSLPGGCRIKEPSGSEASVQFTIPPIPKQEYDPRIVDWVDHLLRTRKSRFMQIPRLSEHPMKISLDTLGPCQATGSPLLAFLEDHGLVTKVRSVEYIDLEVESHRRKIKRFLEGKLRTVYHVDVVKPLTSLHLEYDSLVDYPPLVVWMEGEPVDY